MKDKPASITLTQAIDYFEEAEELTQEGRQSSEKCRDYYDHKQWTASEAATLRKRKQPVITRNRIKPKIDYLKGLEAQTRTDPKAFPRNPQDDESAEAATLAIRFVHDQAKFPKVRSGVFENLAIEGTGGAEVYVKKEGGEYKICIRRFQWDRIFYDPHSRELDYSDVMYQGGVLWMDYEAAKERHPGKEDVLSQTLSNEGQLSETFDDTPRVRWADSKRKRVRVVMLEFKKGEKWYRCEFTKGGFLSGPEESPYVDDKGNPEPSLILQSSHVDREGVRYGWVKAWLDVQDEINKRASKHLHLVSVRQTFSNGQAGADAAKVKAELAKPDGHLDFATGEFGKDFGILPTMDMAQAQFNLMQEAKQEIDSIGVNAALSGSESRDLSGKAIGRLQQGGSTEIKPLLDALGNFNQRVYVAIWHRIKQFWTAEKWVRVTDDENSPKWIGLNQPITLGQQLQEEYGGLPRGIDPNDPRLSIQTGTKNNVAEMDVDIILEEVPDMVNVMQEQFDALTSLYPAIPDNQKEAALEMIVESSSIRNKQKFLDRLKGKDEDPEAQQAAQQMQGQQQQQMQQQMEMMQAQLGKIQSEIERNRAAAMKDMATAQATANPLPDPSQFDSKRPTEMEMHQHMADMSVKDAQAQRHHAAAMKDMTIAHQTMNSQPEPAAEGMV